eukprot:1146539-Pelagomonas_calceolata.AAC.7
MLRVLYARARASVGCACSPKPCFSRCLCLPEPRERVCAVQQREHASVRAHGVRQDQCGYAVHPAPAGPVQECKWNLLSIVERHQITVRSPCTPTGGPAKMCSCFAKAAHECECPWGKISRCVGHPHSVSQADCRVPWVLRAGPELYVATCTPSSHHSEVDIICFNHAGAHSFKCCCCCCCCCSISSSSHGPTLKMSCCGSTPHTPIPPNCAGGKMAHPVKVTLDLLFLILSSCEQECQLHD